MNRPAALSQAQGWRWPLFGVALALLAMLPVLIARYPVMADYPAHLARWHVMINIGHSADLARFYRFDWTWTPSLGIELLIPHMAALFGLEPAGRLLVGLIAVLTGLGLMASEWALRRRIGVGSLLALSTVWAPHLLMGFVNYALSVALAWLAFALWVRLDDRGWRWALFLPIGPLVWLCHLCGWGVLGILVFGYEWAERRGFWGMVRAGFATWPLWPPAALLLFFGAGASGALDFGSGVLWDKLTNWIMGLRDQVPQLDVLTVALLLVLPLLAWARGRADARIGRAALMLGLITFIIPRHMGGGDFADYRLVPVALAAGALAIDLRFADLKRARWIMALAALPFLIRLGVTTAAWDRDSREMADILGALDHVPQGAIVAGAEAEPQATWRQRPFSHVFDYATIRRDALTNAHFSVPGVYMLQLAEPDPGFVDASQRIVLKGGERADLAAFVPARRAQFLWYVGDEPPLRLPAGAVVIHATQHSLLARLANPAVHR